MSYDEIFFFRTRIDFFFDEPQVMTDRHRLRHVFSNDIKTLYIFFLNTKKYFYQKIQNMFFYLYPKFHNVLYTHFKFQIDVKTVESISIVSEFGSNFVKKISGNTVFKSFPISLNKYYMTKVV